MFFFLLIILSSSRPSVLSTLSRDSISRVFSSIALSMHPKTVWFHNFKLHFKSFNFLNNKREPTTDLITCPLGGDKFFEIRMCHPAVEQLEELRAPIPVGRFYLDHSLNNFPYFCLFGQQARCVSIHYTPICAIYVTIVIPLTPHLNVKSLFCKKLNHSK